ncbi:unnamed protein product [Candida verbasci]|uniref:Uncharacterized protein n=1 Tax=Candida verbasci TaxID=1227364 RepID=A0A9W4XG47_9ASCO|nr:unnamed protein product [Candida verbasci]
MKVLKCSDLMWQYILKFKHGIAKLSQRYYYAWRIVKAHNVIGSITIDEFLKTLKHDTLSIPTDTLIELESIM